MNDDFPKRVVLWVNDTPLYLIDLRWNVDGTLRGGEVVNGRWWYELVDGKCYSLYSEFGEISTSWIPNKIEMTIITPICKERQDYNAVIQWATNRDKLTQLIPKISPAPMVSAKVKVRKQNVIDDEIPF